MADQAEARGVAPRGRGADWALVFALVLFGLALLAVLSRYQAPPASAQDVPMTEFSAGRAREILRTLLGDGAPHPVGSPANARVRERILTHLRWLGYEPEVEQGFACTPNGTCARVANVLARLPGREPGKAVLLMAHYDSVGAGPGASDDLAGVAAALEVARILKAEPQPRNTVLFLLDDGEEPGLLGARAFAGQSPAAASVGAIVNLEARGSSGPSLLFETSGESGWMIPLFAGAAKHPVASSLFATIYDNLPNDTDLTVFKDRHVPGLNFAFIGEPLTYHTPADSFERSSPESLQHHGDNALGAVRALAAADLASPPAGRAVFFDLLAFRVVHWPAGWSFALALVALALVLAAVALGRRGGSLSWGSLGLGLLVLPLALLLSGAAAFGLQTLLGAAFPAPWVAHPMPAKAAFWLVTLALTLLAAALLGRRTNPRGIWAGTWILWSLLGVLLAVSAPGTSYLFVVPAAFAGLLGLIAFSLAGEGTGGRALAVIVPGLVAALLWFPTLIFLYDGLGLAGLLVTALLLVFVFSTLGPLAGGGGPLGRKWLPLAAVVLGLIFAVQAFLATPFSPESPRPMSLQLHQDADTGSARWLVFGPPLPAPLREAARFAQQPTVPYPWSPPQARAYVAPAPKLPGSPPVLSVLADSIISGKRHLRLRLTSPRGAAAGLLYIPTAANIETLKVQGQVIPPPADAARAGGPWRIVSDVTLPLEGTELELVLGETKPLDWYVADRSNGLPPAGEALRKARPAWAVPIQNGDTTTVSRKVKI
jgi:hypothetical protein